MTDIATLIEHLAESWLQHSDVGEQLLANAPLDEAIDAVFELLNSGFLKVTVNDSRQPVGFTFSPIPRPPVRTIMRPGKQRH